MTECSKCGEPLNDESDCTNPKCSIAYITGPLADSTCSLPDEVEELFAKAKQLTPEELAEFGRRNREVLDQIAKEENPPASDTK